MWSRVNLGEQRTFGTTLVKWIVLGSLVGVLSGTASAIFLVTLNWATAVRTANPYLLFLLPLAGFVIGTPRRGKVGFPAGSNRRCRALFRSGVAACGAGGNSG